MKTTTLWQVFGSIFLAVFVGWMTGPEIAVFGVPIVKLYGFVGQLFLNALMLIVVPLVCSSIIIATARMASDHDFKVLGTKTFGWFVSTTFVAILISYIFMMLFQPGAGQEGGIAILSNQGLQEPILEGTFEKFEQVFYRIIPTNIIAAAAEGQMLGLICFCMLFGFFSTKINAPASTVVLTFWQGVFEIIMKITHVVMKTLPVGVFALVAKVVAETGFDSIKSVAAFFGVVVFGLSLYCVVILPLLLKFVARVSPLAHFKAMAPALLTAFSTSSSAATMPVTLECLERRAGVSTRVCNFIIPLGTSINMPGAAMHICAAVLFASQAYGIPLSFGMQGMVVVMSLLMSFGLAGTPSSSLFAIVTVLGMAGLPPEGLALTIAIERLLDMLRTVTNVYSNSCCTVLVARSTQTASDMVSTES